MLTKDDVRNMSRQDMIEYMRDRHNPNPGESPLEETEDMHLRAWILRNLPCPAIKRDGDVCGSERVSVSGYCFAHDPEAAGWRAMGGRAKAKKVRARKKLNELGLGDMIEGLQDTFQELQASSPSATNARAMARIADTVVKMTEWASEIERKKNPRSYTEWSPYEP